ncbi:BlaI/MecI/CopY family transcriptional regulator [Nocardia africana]|nr:BlaI/MecI/CopY family transcriptional regulator [Nocardia africana]MCC3316772.1 BlaI/MecI/CopY family transcriptional regulator [Nocardia africana]
MSSRGFGDLESVVMDRVWGRTDSVTVREIYDEMSGEREIAYTTVLSTMDNLRRKGWLDRAREGKAFHYWPTVTREEYCARLMREALGVGGRFEVVLTHFINGMSAEES